MQKDLHTIATIVANALSSSKKRISVVFGEGASTDGTVITLPGDVADDENAKQSVVAYILHECGHIRWSDFEMLKSASPAIALLANAFEDARIEKRLRKEFAGAQWYLERQYEQLTEELDVNSMTFLDRVGCFALCTHSVDSPVLQQQAKKLRGLVAATVGKEKMDRIDQCLSKPVEGSTDCFARAKELFDILVDHLKDCRRNLSEVNQPQMQGSQESSQQQGSCESSQSQSGNGTSAPFGSQSQPQEADERNGRQFEDDKSLSGQECAQGEACDAGDEADDAARGDDGKGKGKNRADAQPNEKSGSTGSEATTSAASAQMEAAEQLRAMRALQEMAGESNSPLDLSTIRDKLNQKSCCDSDLPDSCLTPHVDRRYGREIDFSRLRRDANKEQLEALGSTAIDYARLVAAGLGRGLTGLISAQTVCRNQLRHSGSRLDTRRLSRLAHGDSRVFLKRGEKKGVDTAVCILLDRSGSMRDDQEHLALNAALGLFLALRRIAHVKCAIGQFPFVSPCLTSDAFSESAMINCGFDHKPEQRFAEIGLMTEPSGGTPINLALSQAAGLMRDRTEQRKIVIVATDGYFDLRPDFSEFFKAQGIELAFLFIGSNADEEAKKHVYAEVDGYEQIADAIFAIARRLAPGLNRQLP